MSASTRPRRDVGEQTVDVVPRREEAVEHLGLVEQGQGP
jgi:hypothetical protein